MGLTVGGADLSGHHGCRGGPQWPDMNLGTETEVKLRVRDLTAVRRKIRALGFVQVQARHFESNTLFDFADLCLRKARCLLRLRHANRKSVLTYKGPPEGTRNYKTRREIEIAVSDGDSARAILAGLGMREVFRYEKYRTVFAQRTAQRAAHGSALVIDESPVGNFLELEGSESWIDRTAVRLGYCREDYIIASYAALYRQDCESRGKAPADMLFKSP